MVKITKQGLDCLLLLSGISTWMEKREATKVKHQFPIKQEPFQSYDINDLPKVFYILQENCTDIFLTRSKELFAYLSAFSVSFH